MVVLVLREAIVKKKFCFYGHFPYGGGGIVGKKWEPRNPVPGPFSAKIRKVDENSESSQKIRKVVRILGKAGGGETKKKKKKKRSSLILG